MKRFGFLVLLILIVASLCACSDSSSTEERIGDSSSANLIAEAIEEPEPTESPEPTPEERNGDFRNAFWGDDIDTVKKYEKATFGGETDDCIMYIDLQVAAKDAWALYYFDDEGRLYQAAYKIMEEHSGAARYIQDYETLKEALTNVYGEPTKDLKRNLSSLAEYASDDTALTLGYISYVSTWQTDRTWIGMILSSDNSEISITIGYKDLNHEKVVDTSGL